MEEDTPYFICVVHAVRLIFVLFCQAAIHHDRKRLELTIGAKKQVEIRSNHIVPNEFVKRQIDELAALEDEEHFDFAPTVNHAIVIDEASDHELYHHNHLHRDPDLFDNTAGGGLILCVLLLSQRLVVDQFILGDLSFEPRI